MKHLTIKIWLHDKPNVLTYNGPYTYWTENGFFIVAGKDAILLHYYPAHSIKSIEIDHEEDKKNDD